MQAEIRFENGSTVIRITDIVSGVAKTFGPYSFSEAETILRDYDRQRELFTGA